MNVVVFGLKKRQDLSIMEESRTLSPI